MKVLHKQSCPTCGQSVNERQISLYAGLVEVLHEVYKWCLEKNVHEFSRKEIKHLIIRDVEIARFGDLVYFGGLVYKHSKGHYGLNMQRVSDFFAGKTTVPTAVYKNPLTGETTIDTESYRHVGEIVQLKELLDEKNEFVAVYKQDTLI